VRREAKGELERVEVDERGHERARDVVGDAEEERALHRVCFPAHVEAPDILREVRARRERLAAAQGGSRYGRHHRHHHLYRRRRRRRCSLKGVLVETRPHHCSCSC